jgi:hypothetical protein
MTSWLALVLILIGAAQGASHRDASARQVPTTATLRGRVVTADTGVPVRDCFISVFQDPGSDVRYARTGADGRFEVKDLRPGSYRITATPTSTHTSYLPGGVRDGDDTNTILVVDVVAGKAVEDLDIRLVRGAAISGRVLDGRGEPVRGVDVFAARTGSGRLEWVGAQRPTLTDDLGRFRIPGLTAGTYILLGQQYDASSERTPDRTSFLSTYYPDALDPATAIPIAVDSGQELEGIELRLVRGRTYSARGRIVDVQGQPAPKATGAVLRPLDSRPGLAAWGLTVDPDGTFEVENLPPGRYTLRASLASTDGATRQQGAVPILVTDSDLQDITIALQPAARMAGVIRVDSNRPGPPLSSVRVQAHPLPRETGFGDERLGAPVDDAGRFELSGLHGPVLVRPQVPEGWFLEGVFLGDRDITDTSTDFGTAADRQLLVTISSGGSEVSGSITAAGKAAPGISLMVFSQDPALWSFAFTTTRSTHAGVDGRYAVRGLRPGRYYIAIAPPSPLANEPAEYFERLSREATPFEIGRDQRVTVDLAR